MWNLQSYDQEVFVYLFTKQNAFAIIFKYIHCYYTTLWYTAFFDCVHKY